MDTQRLLGTSAATALTAIAGSVATQEIRTRWYERLDKPPYQPPGWVFPIAWTALYSDIAVSSAVALEEMDEAEARRFKAALATNLVLNAGWCWVFFKGHRLSTGTGVGAALAISSWDLARRAGSASPASGVALTPYAVWTTFAAVLSGGIARRNPRADSDRS